MQKQHGQTGLESATTRKDVIRCFTCSTRKNVALNDAAFCSAVIRIGAMILLVACGTDSVFGQSPPPPNFGSGFATPLNSQPSERIASAPSLDATQSTDPLSLGGAEGVTEATQAESAIPLSNLVSVIRKGGILMFPIMVCSVVLMVFVLERLFFLRRSRIMPRLFVRGVLEQLEQNQIEQEEAIELCEQNGSPIAELYVTALKKWGRPAVEIEQAVLDAGDHVTSQLKKYLRLFSAISNLTPLLGLLGTVLGMINAFNAIAQADAMGRPELLAAGIGGALITTAAGLCVAIPAYAAYAFFVGRSDRLILEMDAMAQDLIEQISAEAQPGTKRRARKAA